MLTSGFVSKGTLGEMIFTHEFDRFVAKVIVQRQHATFGFELKSDLRFGYSDTSAILRI